MVKLAFDYVLKIDDPTLFQTFMQTFKPGSFNNIIERAIKNSGLNILEIIFN